jgi:hypothetical protein
MPRNLPTLPLRMVNTGAQCHRPHDLHVTPQRDPFCMETVIFCLQGLGALLQLQQRLRAALESVCGSFHR